MVNFIELSVKNIKIAYLLLFNHLKIKHILILVYKK